MHYIERTPDEICDELDAMYEMEAHDIAEVELWEIAGAISEAHENLGNAVRDWLSETAKIALGEIPYGMSAGNRQFPSDGLLDGLLANPIRAFKAITDNLPLSSSKTGEFKWLLTCSGLTLQERTAVVLRYMHRKSEHEISSITGYGDAEGILWASLVKIGKTILHDKK